MQALLDEWFGDGEPGYAAMAVRAVVVFVYAVLLMRLSGRRSLGQTGALDVCVMVLLGAVLSRAVVGTADFGPTLLAAGMIALLHRVAALACVLWPRLERLISGTPRELLQRGRLDRRQARKGLVTDSEIETAVRKKVGDDTQRVRRILLERDGSITVVASAQGAGGAGS